MKKRDNFVLAKKGNRSFVISNAVFAVILLFSVIFSAFDCAFCIIPWTQKCCDLIGIMCQVITAIVAFVVSLISISISLQQDNCLGIKISDVHKLRKNPHYTIRVIVIVAMLLCVFNLAFFMVSMTFSSVVFAATAVVFCIHIVFVEIPFMMKDEKAIINVIRNNMIANFGDQDKETSKELKGTVEFLISGKTLKETYSLLKDDTIEDYNRYLCLKLLEFQADSALDLALQNDERKAALVSNSILNNVKDVLCFSFDLEQIFGGEFLKMARQIVRTLSGIEKRTEGKTCDLIAETVKDLEYQSSRNNARMRFLISVVLMMNSYAIKDGNCKYLKAMRKQYSLSVWDLRKENCSSLIFALLSMQLYYLCVAETNVPQKTKMELLNFIQWSGVENGVSILSWKSLFSIFQENFNVNCSDFMSEYEYNKPYLEYVPLSSFAHEVVLDNQFAYRWYITNLLNSRRIVGIDFQTINLNKPEFNYYLIKYGNECYENNVFKPSDKIKEIIAFYSGMKEPFSLFSIMESINHNFFNYINELKKDGLMKKAKEANDLQNENITSTIRKYIESHIIKEWGYNGKLDIKNAQRRFCCQVEKSPSAFNFYDMLNEYFYDAVIYDIRNFTTRKTIWKDENFEETIKILLQYDFKYATCGSVENIRWYVKDEELKNLLLEKCKNVQPIGKSHIFQGDNFFQENGFSFNFKIDELEARGLNEKEVAEEVEKHQRKDGQHIFCGTIVSAEEIAKIVSEKFVIITFVFRHQVQTFDNAIIDINLFPKENGN